MGVIVTDVGEQKKEQQVEQTTHRELKKHAAIIHCTNNLSLLQRKISNALLYHAYDELISREEHEISVKELCQLIAYQGNNHAVIRDALRGLLATVIEWNVVNDVTGVEDWTASSILASVSLQGPKCFYAYSPRMKQLLHSPSMFGRINLFIQSRFRSGYGLALYENCIRYRGLGVTKWFDMTVFRKLMGVPADKYTVFRDFKRRVLDKSIEEVNTYSDLVIEPEYAREGRLVKQLRFTLKERPRRVRLGVQKNEIPLLTNSEKEQLTPLQTILTQQYGLSMSQMKEVFAQHDEAFICEKITVIESSRSFREGRVQNPAAFFLSALKNDWQVNTPAMIEMTSHPRRIEELEASAKKIRKLCYAQREALLDNLIASLDVTEKQRLETDFREYAADAIRTVLKLQRAKYTTETIFSSPQIRGMFRQFFLQIQPAPVQASISLKQILSTFPAADRDVFTKLALLAPDHELLAGLI